MTATSPSSSTGPRRAPRTLRTRLTATFAAVVAATLVLVGLGTLALVRSDARRTTERELAEQVQGFGNVLRLARVLDQGQVPALGAELRGSLARAFRLDDLSTLSLTRGGELVGDPPAGLPLAALDPVGLASDQVVHGRVGSRVFAAVALGPRRPGAVVPARGARDVLVVVRSVDAGVGDAGRWFVVSGLLTIVITFVVADRLAVRITRPVDEVADVARRVAAGDLRARAATPASDDELAALATAVNSMAEDLERERDLDRNFLMSVSHDLRTPLTAIAGYAEGIADGATDPAEAAVVIGESARRLERLVGDLLDLARLQAHQFSLAPEIVDAAAVAAAVAEAASPAAAEFDITVTHVDPSPDDLDAMPRKGAEALRREVRADPDRLAQALANLVDNALRFATSRVTVRTEVATDATDDVTVVVTDDGPGFDATDLPRVFDRLYISSRRPGRQIGTGLGLTIARELIEAMDGTIKADNVPGGGARVEVRLPPA